jgi:hypothetical protein
MGSENRKIKSFVLHYDTKFTNNEPKSTLMKGGRREISKKMKSVVGNDKFDDWIYAMGNNGRVNFETRIWGFTDPSATSAILKVLKGNFGDNVTDIIYE